MICGGRYLHTKDALDERYDGYQFGDISKEIERRRAQWVQDFLGPDAGEYQFGDITKKAVKNFTGKDDYEFGDVTKKLMSNIFGPRRGVRSSENNKLPAKPED